MCELAAVSRSHCQGKPEKTDLNTHFTHTDCHRADYRNPTVCLQVWGQRDTITRIRAVWWHKQKLLAKQNAWLRPACQIFWLVNKLLVSYFECNVLSPLYKNSLSGKQETWTKVTLQWPSLCSWGVLWRSCGRAEIPPSLLSTRRGKGSCGHLVPGECFPQNNPKHVALSCCSVLSTGCHCFLFYSPMALY